MRENTRRLAGFLRCAHGTQSHRTRKTGDVVIGELLSNDRRAVVAVGGKRRRRGTMHSWDAIFKRAGCGERPSCGGKVVEPRIGDRKGKVFIRGGPGGSRTHTQRIMSPLL